MMGGIKAGYDCIKAFSETDFTEDLKKFDVPTLILHGEDDQIVPIGAAALQSAKLVKGATLKVYPGFPAWNAHDQRGPDQCRSARVRQAKTSSGSVRVTRPSLRWEGRILDRVEEKRDGLADVNDPSL